MFAMYVEVKDAGGYAAVAKSFGRHVNTVRSVARKHKWDERYQKLQRKIEDKQDREVADDVVKRMKQMKALFAATLAKCYVRGEDGKFELRKKTVGPSDAIAVAEYLDKLAERYGAVGGEAMSPHIKEHLERAFSLLQRLPDRAVDALGNWIVQHASDFSIGEDTGG